jgi:hypothetical protein
VLRVQTGEGGLLLRKRPPEDKLCDRSHADAERQQGREALDVVVAFDTQRRDREATLETVAEAFNPVCMPITPHRLRHRAGARAW